MTTEAQEDEFGLSVTEVLEVQAHTNNFNHSDEDDDYGILINRLHISGASDDLTALLRVDSAVYASFNEERAEGFEDDVARLERLTVQYFLGDWTLRAGDSFAQLGRGIALSAREVPGIGLDVALRGGQLQYADDSHQLLLFGGMTNPVNLDEVSQHFIEDTDDILAGASYELKTLPIGDVGFYGLYFEPRERLLDDRDFTVSTGLYSDLNQLADWMVIYLEGDFQSRTLAGVQDEGFGGYLTFDLAFGDLGVLLEGLVLTDYELRGSRSSALGSRAAYNSPPTLERIDQEVFQTPNVGGGRLGVDLCVPSLDMLLYANTMIRLNEPFEPGELRQIHAYGGADVNFHQGLGHLNAAGGYRDETQQGEPFSSMVHGELDFLFPLEDRLSLQLTTLNEFRTLLGDEYVRGSTSTGLQLSGLGGISFELGYDTQHLFSNIRNIFFAGTLFWEISERFQLTVTGGSQRGGLKCIEGVCRDFPAFTGGRSLFVARF